eukprot:1654904-Rhodomonas_salina.3
MKRGSDTTSSTSAPCAHPRRQPSAAPPARRPCSSRMLAHRRLEHQQCALSSRIPRGHSVRVDACALSGFLSFHVTYVSKSRADVAENLLEHSHVDAHQQIRDSFRSKVGVDDLVSRLERIVDGLKTSRTTSEPDNDPLEQTETGVGRTWGSGPEIQSPQPSTPHTPWNHRMLCQDWALRSAFAGRQRADLTWPRSQPEEAGPTPHRCPRLV